MGKFFENLFLNDFCLRFGFPAVGINVLEKNLCLGWFLELLLLRLEGHGGERFG